MMNKNERIALVTALVRAFPDCDEQQANPTKGWLNEHGEWLTWEDMNPHYIDNGAPHACEVCNKPVVRGWAGDGIWCSPACLWGDDNLESILFDFRPEILGEDLYYTEWGDDEADEDGDMHFLDGERRRVVWVVVVTNSGIPDLSVFTSVSKAWKAWVDDCEAPREAFDDGFWTDGDDVEIRLERVVVE